MKGAAAVATRTRRWTIRLSLPLAACRKRSVLSRIVWRIVRELFRCSFHLKLGVDCLLELFVVVVTGDRQKQGAARGESPAPGESPARDQGSRLIATEARGSRRCHCSRLIATWCHSQINEFKHNCVMFRALKEHSLQTGSDVI